jgi:hypothetical protein
MLRIALVLQDIGIGLAVTALVLMGAAMCGIAAPAWSYGAAGASVLCAVAFTGAIIAARSHEGGL